jgi:hypothetical protein
MVRLIMTLLVVFLVVPCTVNAQSPLTDFMPQNFFDFSADCKTFGGIEITLAPYAWLAGMEGTLGVNGRTAQIDISPSEALSMLDIAFFNFAQIRKGNALLLSDFMYSSLSDSQQVGRRSSVDSSSEMIAGDLMLGYRVARYPITIDLFAGARYMSTSNFLRINTILGSFEGSADRDWTDPVIGSRFMFNITEDIGFQFRFDVGGFNVSSENVWNLVTGFNFRYNDSMRFILGYRHMSYRYFDNTGFTFDVGLGGFGSALVFTF